MIAVQMLCLVLQGDVVATGRYAHLNEPTVRFVAPPPSAPPSYSKHQPWYEVTFDVFGRKTYHPTSDQHLIKEHKVSPSSLKGLTQEQKDRLHGMHHSRPSCPNGQCPLRR